MINPYTDLPHVLVIQRHYNMNLIDVVCIDGTANFLSDSWRKMYERTPPSLTFYMGHLIYTATTRGKCRFENFQLLK